MKNNITIENGNLVLAILLKYKSTYTYGDGEYEVDNICGLDWGGEYSIASLNYLDYKDDFQVGMPLIMLEDKEEFDELCKRLDLMVFTYNKCAECKDILTGSFTINDKGEDICIEHNEKD